MAYRSPRRLLFLLLIACSASKAQRVDRSACERDAQGQYEQCTGRSFYFHKGEQHKVPDNEQLQACELAYGQALQRCAEYDGPKAPEIDLTKTSSVSR